MPTPIVIAATSGPPLTTAAATSAADASIQTTTALAPEGTQTLLERMFPYGGQTAATIDRVQGVFANPGQDQQATIMVAAIAVLAVVFLSLLALSFALPRRKRIVKVRTYTGEDAVRAQAIAEERAAQGKGGSVVSEMEPEVAAAQQRKRNLRSWLTGPLPAAILVAVAFIGAYSMTSTQMYCAQTCHAISPASTGAQKIAHAKCRQCHEAPLVSGVVQNSSSRVRMLYVAATSQVTFSSRRPVDSSACMRCHNDLEEATTSKASGIVMSHREPIAAGYPCTSCHDKSGHTRVRTTASMSDCLPCHDGKQAASAECDSCHARNPVMVKSGGGAKNETPAGRTFPAVRAAKRECTGCHDMTKQCDPCHRGIRMPHTEDYTSGGGHAKQAAFEGKVRCWTCHDPAECGTCHKGSFSADGTRSSHEPNWKEKHKRADWSGGCVCHSGMGPRGKKPMCILCHAEHYE